MKSVLIGSDLMYRQDGKLVPIEINTNVGWDNLNRVERKEDVFDPSFLVEYVQSHGITDIYFDGYSSQMIYDIWPEDTGVEVHQGIKESEREEVYASSTKLYVRAPYDEEAYIDSFCRDKVNFLQAIEGLEIGSEYIAKIGNSLIGSITEIEDNGTYPNFIVKYRYPVYNTDLYPMLLRFTSLEQLNAWVEKNLEEDFIIMPFYFNEEKGMWNNSPKIIRNWSIFVANEEETLDSVYVGKYTKIAGKIEEGEVFEWDEEGNALDPGKVREAFLTSKWVSDGQGDLLVEEDDVILMEDNTWKAAKDLEEGDRVKAVTIPADGAVDIRKHTADYNVSFNQLQEESEYTINELLSKRKLDGFVDEVVLNFTDGTDWFDSTASSYPTLDSEDETVRFSKIGDLKVGDKVILMSAKSSTALKSPKFVIREIESIETRRVQQSGYELTLDGNHLFLSKTAGEKEAYISIEHNAQQAVTCSWSEGSTSCSSSNKNSGLPTTGLRLEIDGAPSRPCYAKITISVKGVDYIFSPISMSTDGNRLLKFCTVRMCGQSTSGCSNPGGWATTVQVQLYSDSAGDVVFPAGDVPSFWVGNVTWSNNMQSSTRLSNYWNASMPNEVPKKIQLGDFGS